MAFNGLIWPVVLEEMSCKWTERGKCYSYDPGFFWVLKKTTRPSQVEAEKKEDKSLKGVSKEGLAISAVGPVAPCCKGFSMTQRHLNSPARSLINQCIHQLADDGLDDKEGRRYCNIFSERDVIVPDSALIPAIIQMFCRKQPMQCHFHLITVFRVLLQHCFN